MLAFLAIFFVIRLAAALSTRSTILLISRDKGSADSASVGLLAYGIPFETLIVPSSGVTLPELTTGGVGNYGGLVVVSEVSYQYGASYLSALTATQWNQLFEYQTSFGVRLVRLDAYPSPEFGVTPASASGEGCCNAGQEQVISLTDTSDFPTANVNSNVDLSTLGLWHYPARITNTTTTKPIARFGATLGFDADTVAAVINNAGGRQQMVWFMGWAGTWSITSTFLQHAWIHWVTRGLYVGFRRIYLNTQVDDVFLITDIYDPPGALFRIRPEDMDRHVSWLTSINSRMPAGSFYFSEMGHNGNGDIEASVGLKESSGVCAPRGAIEYADQSDVAYDFVKPLGSGTDVWPTTPKEYVWTSQCAAIDPLMKWFQDPSRRDRLAHVSHTFTHYELNNATYSDASKEIVFNRAWMSQVGLSGASRFSKSGLIPPAITGLLNGDVIRAWLENGITSVVGDNTRPTLANLQNPYWPLISSAAGNGQDGLVIMPRWATTIYYNCDLPACTAKEWAVTSAGVNDFQVLLQDARAVNVRHLLSLRHDAFMFHQANLRSADVEPVSINGESRQLSIMEAWVEVVVQEMARLTNWPIVSLKHDDLAQDFINRMARDNCKPQLTYNYATDGSAIQSVTVSAVGNSCAAEIPVTFPAAVADSQGARSEQLGADPLTLWVKLTGQPQTFTLASAVPR